MEEHALLADNGAEVSAQDVLEMLELRINVEVASAGLAAVRRTEAQLQALRATLDEFTEAYAAGANTTPADFQFHLQIAQATGNLYFEEVLRNLGRRTIHYASPPVPAPASRLPTKVAEALPNAQQFGESLARLSPGKAITMREHEAIYEAIRLRDPEAARTAMRVHLDQSRERLRKIMDPDAT